MLHHDLPARASLGMLIILQLVMLTSLYAQIPPHPPQSTPLFGMGPFIAAALSLAAAALIIGPLNGKAGRILGLLAAVLALVSFGPQKYLDPQLPLIWPAVICGQAAAVTLIVQTLSSKPRSSDRQAG